MVKKENRNKLLKASLVLLDRAKKSRVRRVTKTLIEQAQARISIAKRI